MLNNGAENNYRNRFGRLYHWRLFLREYASYIKDSMVAELTDLNRNLMMSIDVVPIPTDEAVQEINTEYDNKLLEIRNGNTYGWKCACGATVTGKFCPECGAKKPEPVQSGAWKCKCGATATGKFCPECGSPTLCGMKIIIMRLVSAKNISVLQPFEWTG